MSRYDKRIIVKNDNELYKTTFKDRKVNYIRQYLTPELKHPTAEELSDVEMVGHIWKVGDRLFKLAHKFYGDARLWYLIAWFNQKPTESHIKLGDVVYIPLPLERVLQILGI